MEVNRVLAERVQITAMLYHVVCVHRPGACTLESLIRSFRYWRLNPRYDLLKEGLEYLRRTNRVTRCPSSGSFIAMQMASTDSKELPILVAQSEYDSVLERILCDYGDSRYFEELLYKSPGTALLSIRASIAEPQPSESEFSMLLELALEMVRILAAWNPTRYPSPYKIECIATDAAIELTIIGFVEASSPWASFPWVRDWILLHRQRWSIYLPAGAEVRYARFEYDHEGQPVEFLDENIEVSSSVQTSGSEVACYLAADQSVLPPEFNRLQIKHVHACGMKLSDVFTQCPNVSSACLIDCKVDDVSLFRQCYSLALVRPKFITGLNFHLPNLTHLQILEIDETTCAHAGNSASVLEASCTLANVIKTAHRLRFLTVTDGSLECLDFRQPLLDMLYLKFVRVEFPWSDADHWKFLMSLPSLESLIVTGCKQPLLNPVLSSLPHLRNLVVED